MLYSKFMIDFGLEFRFFIINLGFFVLFIIVYWFIYLMSIIFILCWVRGRCKRIEIIDIRTIEVSVFIEGFVCVVGVLVSSEFRLS